MNGERNIGDRIGNFLIFVALSIITVGIYPVYFAVTRIEEQNVLLEQILSQTRRNEKERTD